MSNRPRRPPYRFRYAASTMARGWRRPCRGCEDGAALKEGCDRPPRRGPSPPPSHCKAGCISRARKVSCSGRNVGSFSPSTASFITRVSHLLYSSSSCVSDANVLSFSFKPSSLCLLCVLRAYHDSLARIQITVNACPLIRNSSIRYGQRH